MFRLLFSFILLFPFIIFPNKKLKYNFFSSRKSINISYIQLAVSQRKLYEII